MCNLKAVQTNVQRMLIWDLLLYEFELNHNAAEATKNICCAKGEGTVDNNTVIKYMKKFYLDCKDLDDPLRQIRQVALEEYQASSVSYSLVWFVILKSGEFHSSTVSHSPEWFITFTTSTNPTSSSRRVSGEIRISQTSVVCYRHNLSKSGESHTGSIRRDPYLTD